MFPVCGTVNVATPFDIDIFGVPVFISPVPNGEAEKYKFVGGIKIEGDAELDGLMLAEGLIDKEIELEGLILSLGEIELDTELLGEIELEGEILRLIDELGLKLDEGEIELL
jgi:hypothetical protein